MHSLIWFILFSCLMFIQSVSGQLSRRNELPVSLHIPTGAIIRVQTIAETTMEGQYGGRKAGNLVLLINQHRLEIPTDSILKIWQLGRATVTWAKTGAYAGAIAGGVALGVGSYLVSGLCEYDCPPSRTGYALKVGIGGMVLGGATGVLLGAFIGSTHHYWRLKYQYRSNEESMNARSGKNSQGELQRAPNVTHERLPITEKKHHPKNGAPQFRLPPIGYTSIHLNFSRTIDGDTPGGFGAGMNYLTFILPNLAVGLDVHLFHPGNPREPEESSTLNRRVLHAGGIIRYSLSTQPIQPYVFTGVYYSVYWYGNYVGYSFGGGIGYLFPGTHYLLSAEGRWSGNTNGLRLVNFALGMGYIW